MNSQREIEFVSICYHKTLRGSHHNRDIFYKLHKSDKDMKNFGYPIMFTVYQRSFTIGRKDRLV